MTDEQRDSGTGWPESTVGPPREGTGADPRPDAPPADGVGPLVDEPSSLGAAGGARAPDPEEDPSGGTETAGRVEPADEAEPAVPVEPADEIEPAIRADPEDRAERAGGEDGVWARLGLRRPRLTGAGAMIGVLLALLGFTLAVQLKTSSADPALSTMRQDDLVRILSDLESQESRLRQDVGGLEDSQRQLTSGAEGRQAALDEATRRADELGILAGTLPARGPGLVITFSASSAPVRASTILDAVEELRGAGAEALQISDRGSASVRIVASTYFLDGDGGSITVSGRRLIGPYTITVIGDPTTMRTALNIPGGVVASVNGDGGNVIVQEREVVDVAALSAPTSLKHARPVS